jgi:hypothetical protein
MKKITILALIKIFNLEGLDSCFANIDKTLISIFVFYNKDMFDNKTSKEEFLQIVHSCSVDNKGLDTMHILYNLNNQEIDYIDPILFNIIKKHV